MKKILYVLLISCFGFTFIISCGDKDEYESWEKKGYSPTEDISISSSASDNATVTFGQSYQHQVTTTGTYSGTITYSLSNQPDGMSISSSGLVEWTPTKASQITTHSNITITITTASGYVLTQTYDLTVTGTCTSGNVLSIWKGDQRSSTDSSNLLGNITAYTDNASDNCGPNNNLDCTAENNYQFNQPITSSENLNIGPETSAEDGIMFFYNQYDNTTHTYLFWMFGKGDAAFTPEPNLVKLDLFVSNNESTDVVVVEDDNSNEIGKQNSGCGSSDTCYKARYTYYSKKSDGGVIGPFSGSSYRIFIDIKGFSTINSSDNLTLGNLDSFTYWSKDNSYFSLGDVDNFTVGYKTTINCSN